jgi:hypothetical protein
MTVFVLQAGHGAWPVCFCGSRRQEGQIKVGCATLCYYLAFQLYAFLRSFAAKPIRVHLCSSVVKNGFQLLF